MSFDLVDALYRSRLTLMEILELRGFETASYSRFSPKEIQAMSVNLPAAGFTVPHKTDPDRKCVVMYRETKLSRKSDVIMEKLRDEDMNIEKTDVIMLTQEPIKELHHLLSYDLWSKEKLRASFFCIYNIINNPLKHVLVPRHERATPEEQEEVLSKTTGKSQLPIIRYHLDPIGRVLGLIPGELVKITRPSPSAGVYETYRLCTP